MKMIHITGCCLTIILALSACRNTSDQQDKKIASAERTTTPTIHIRPLGDIEDAYIHLVKKSIESFYQYPCIIEPKAALTPDLLAISKTRYDATKILASFNDKTYKLIITTKDIAHKKNNDPEYGILGLGYRPDTTCVISTFRMRGNANEKKFKERLEKVALHEIGHNLGLKHCSSNAQCLMNDAKGSIKQVDREKKEMCSSCLKKLPGHAKEQARS